MSDIFKNQTLKFEFTVTDQDDVVVDISTATLTVDFKKPGGTLFTRVATLTSGGLDGKMEYTSPVDELDEINDWKIQGLAVIGAEEYPTTIEKFKVSERLGG